MEQNFIQILSQNGIDITEMQRQQFQKYFEILVEWNAKMNLTAITEKDAVYNRHFLDSASIAFFYDMNKVETLCDVGSGAGFPSIVLKILFPHLQITIVEALNKRITFLKHLISELNLENITFIHARAEEYGKHNREQFDIVTARAVAKLKMLAELCVPLVKVDGLFIAMKGSNAEQELENSKSMLTSLGITEIEEKKFTLINDEQREIYFCLKTKKTAIKYPRAFAQIKKDNQ